MRTGQRRTHSLEHAAVAISMASSDRTARIGTTKFQEPTEQALALQVISPARSHALPSRRGSAHFNGSSTPRPRVVRLMLESHALRRQFSQHRRDPQYSPAHFGGLQTDSGVDQAFMHP